MASPPPIFHYATTINRFHSYPKTSSSGAGRAVAVSKKGRQSGTTLFPSKPYYRDDLWVFNMSTG